MDNEIYIEIGREGIGYVIFLVLFGLVLMI